MLLVVTLESRPQRIETVLAQSAGGATVLLSIEDGQYYALDEVGARAWEQCDGTRNLPEIARELYLEFDAPLAQIEADILELLSDLEDAKLVE
jgi:hypothetical protein